MKVKWQPENTEGTLWSATMADGQQGWFEIQMERIPDGWDWVINHDHRFWGQENTLATRLGPRPGHLRLRSPAHRLRLRTRTLQ
jgi:hypothetical protein